ncbi:MAG: hypothetical protein II997_03745 [Clostridia bacterium]|nr:hypothetical protein [Clostridia bacterium]
MINIVLYDEESIVRIAERVMIFFSNEKDMRTTNDTVWLKGAYFRFRSRSITINLYDNNFLLKDNILKSLNYILSGEEIYISNSCQKKEYFNFVNSSTNFDTFFADCVV